MVVHCLVFVFVDSKSYCICFRALVSVFLILLTSPILQLGTMRQHHMMKSWWNGTKKIYCHILPNFLNVVRNWFCTFLIHILIRICALFYKFLYLFIHSVKKVTVSKLLLRATLARMSVSMCQIDCFILKFFWENYSFFFMNNFISCDCKFW